MFRKRGETEINTDKIDTIIGQGTVFVGKLVSNGTLRIDGRLEGEVEGKGDIIVGETGSVQADVKARHLTLAGEIKGNLELTGKLELTSTAKLLGDIRVESLVIGDGAKFVGNSTMNNSQSEQPLKREKTEKK